MNMTMNSKVGWGIAAAVIVIALIAYAIYQSQAPIVPVVDMATTTAPTTTPPAVAHPIPAKPVTSGTVAAAPAPASTPAPAAPSPTVSSDGTILFQAPISVVIPTGKTAVEKLSGLRITVKKIDSEQKTPVNQVEPTVATITVNTGVCVDGACTSREDTAQNIMFSTGQSVTYGGYTISLKSLTLESATISISKAL